MVDIMVVVFVILRYVFSLFFVYFFGFVGDFLCCFIIGGNFMWIGGVVFVFIFVVIVFECCYVVVRFYLFIKKLIMVKLWGLVILFWVFVLLFNLLLFFIMFYDSEINFCIENWLNFLFLKLYGIVWFCVVGVLLVIFMVIVYLKIVY